MDLHMASAPRRHHNTHTVTYTDRHRKEMDMPKTRTKKPVHYDNGRRDALKSVPAKKTSTSFFAAPPSPPPRDSKTKSQKTSRSFHCGESIPLTAETLAQHNKTERKSSKKYRYCEVHPEIRLDRKESSEEKCPKCKVELMKLAAKELERRAAELERERTGKEADTKNRRKRRKDCRLVSSLNSKKDSQESSQKGKGKGQNARQQEIDALLRWSSAFDYVSDQRQDASLPRPCTERTRSSEVAPPPPPPARTKSSKKKSGRKERKSEVDTAGSKRCPRPPLVHQFSIGQVAQPSEMYIAKTREETLIKIARLREGDGAFVKRSDCVWTFAVLKARDSGPDACLVFTVNGRGATKKFPMTQWVRYVRLIAEDFNNSNSDDEHEIDLMMSEASLFEVRPSTREVKGDNTDDDSTDGSSEAFSIDSSDDDSSDESEEESIQDIKAQVFDHESSTRTVNPLGNSFPSILLSGSANDLSRPKNKVSFQFPETDHTPSVCSSSGQTSSTSSSSYYADDDAEEGKSSPNVNFRRTISASSKSTRRRPRSNSSSSNSTSEETNSQAPRPSPTQRVSWSDQLDEVKEEIPEICDTELLKKNLGQLNPEHKIPQNNPSKDCKHESFFSALKTIQHRPQSMTQS